MDPIVESLDALVLLLGAALTIVSLAIGTWLFRMRSHH